MEYDDFAVINPSDMDKVAKEYNKMIKMQKELKNKVVFKDKELILSYFTIIEDRLSKVSRQIKKEDYINILNILKRNYLKLCGLMGEINKYSKIDVLNSHDEKKGLIEIMVEFINRLLEQSDNEQVRAIIKDLLSIFVYLS